MILASALLAFFVLTFLVLRYSLFLPRVKGIPVLMYHKVSHADRDFLTVTESDFENQLQFMIGRGYQSISMSQFVDLIENKLTRDKLPKNAFLITFDDGYESNVSLALPILKRLKQTACLFVTSSYIEQGESGSEAGKDAQYLSVSQLKEWCNQGMELALHSHNHPNYRQISIPEILADLATNRTRLKEWNLSFVEAVAYPFGARPKNKSDLNKVKEALRHSGLRAAFRIGNRIHSERAIARGVDAFDVCRIDVRGDDPFFEFKIKALKGRSKQL